MIHNLADRFDSEYSVGHNSSTGLGPSLSPIVSSCYAPSNSQPRSSRPGPSTRPDDIPPPDLGLHNPNAPIQGHFASSYHGKAKNNH